VANQKIPRRQFLLGSGLASAAFAAGPVSAKTDSPAVAQSKEPDPLLTLNATEAAFITAVVDTLIPRDDLSPSASECGVTTFIDRQLAGAYGSGARLYRDGPFLPGKPEHGYQLALTPREYFRAGISAANEWSLRTYGKDLDRLRHADREAALRALELGTADLAGIQAKEFFEALLQITMEGFFADPIHGGNRDKAGWRMVGYPGLPALYRSEINTHFNRKYDPAPQSITDFS
jgi:gluconate 2-dehydrogenase gamma chain